MVRPPTPTNLSTAQPLNGCGRPPQPFLFAVRGRFPSRSGVGGILLVDNSNTRTKFVLAQGTGVTDWRETLMTREVTEESVGGLLEGLDFEASVLCSVVPAKEAILAGVLGAAGAVHAISHQSRLPIEITYPNPAQIGADRLANAVAVHRRCGSPAIVVDFGTAVTFDVVGPPGCYLGGAIAPGLASMTENLSQRTALLPQIDLAEPASAVGKSTEEAMQVGAVLGYRGLIREILAAITAEIGGTPAVVATGGDAEVIARGLPDIHQVLPELTLEGILEIGQHNL